VSLDADVAKVRELAARISTACTATRHGFDADAIELLGLASEALLKLLALVEELAGVVSLLRSERDYLRRRGWT
jgi:hypothetical protein